MYHRSPPKIECSDGFTPRATQKAVNAYLRNLPHIERLTEPEMEELRAELNQLLVPLIVLERAVTEATFEEKGPIQ